MHQHTHETNKKIINRMSRIIGHTKSIKKMIEDNRDCSQVLIQIAAVQSALNGVGKILLNEHIDHCVINAINSDEDSKTEILQELSDAIDKFIR